MFERFTDSARRVVVLAQEQAREMHHDYIGTEHLLLGIAREGQSRAAAALVETGMGYEELLGAVRHLVEDGNGGLGGHVPFTPRAKKVLEMSLREALQLGHNYIGTEHLLLALCAEDEGLAAQVFAALKVRPEDLRRAVIMRMSAVETNPTMGEREPQAGTGARTRAGREGTKMLETFAVNLTQRAHDGQLDPVIGRDRETERLIQILSRRTKNNPVLVGEPGVGKTAVVEGLAQRIVRGDVPDTLEGAQIYAVDLGGLVAGTRYRGDFEERLKKLLAEIVSRDDVVVFFDEIHSVVGAGGNEGALDAANLMKPLLARGELRVIGATTSDEYRKYFEKDAALERRFQPVQVDQPSVNDTVSILKGLRERYAQHHDVTITDDALEAAARLADRYIADRQLPDKAIDLIDEAGAKLRVQRSMSAISDEQAVIDSELAECAAAKRAAVDEQRYEDAGRLRNRERVLLEQRHVLTGGCDDREVSAHTIAEVLALWTGIPVGQLSEDDASRLVRMEAELHQRIIGQDEAVRAVSRAIRRSRVGIGDPRRPSGSFIFLGPTGVGKTELAKTLAEFLFGDEDAMITLDMSEYMEKHAVSRLMGSPPGYVGHEEGGQLTEAVRRKPFSVVLFDEIEKAHPDVFNTLLQILEEGRLTDSQGRSVDFRNTIVIMTSNLGSTDLRKTSMGFANGDPGLSYERMQAKVHEALKAHFRPEFLNRIDETIVFHELDLTDVETMVNKMTTRLVEHLASRGVGLELTDAARHFVAQSGYDPSMGARPLRRAIQRLIEDPLSERLLAGEFPAGTLVIVDHEGDQLAFHCVEGFRLDEPTLHDLPA